MENKNLEEIVLTKRKRDKGEIIRDKMGYKEEKLEGMTFKIADTKEELESAFRLVHDTYVKEGYMDPHPSGMRISKYYLNPRVTTFVGKVNGNVRLTMTLYPDSGLGLPMDSIYKKELDELRIKGRYIAEVGSFAAHKDSKNGNSTIPLYLNKIMHTYARDHLKIDDLVIAINPKHKLFYQEVLLFDVLDGVKEYPDVKGNPAIAMIQDLHLVEEKFKRVYNNKPLEKNLYYFYFVKETDCISLPKNKEVINVWNNELREYFFKNQNK